MTSRFALGVAVAATAVFGAVGGAFADSYEVTQLVPGSAFHGVHGLGIDSAGRLFAGSVAGAALYEVDRDKGTAKIAIPSPEGMADDISSRVRIEEDRILSDNHYVLHKVTFSWRRGPQTLVVEVASPVTDRLYHQWRSAHGKRSTGLESVSRVIELLRAL